MPRRNKSILTGRDAAVLADVYKYRYLSVSQIARLHFPSRQTAYRRLRAMTHLKLLCGFTAPNIPEHLYYLDIAGADVVAGSLGVEVAQLCWQQNTRTPKDYYFISHFLQINDFRISLSRGAPPEVSVLGFIPEYLGGRNANGGVVKHIRDYVCDIERRQESLNHTPDGVFALIKSGMAALFFLEIDRGTEVVGNDSKGVLKACRFYLNYLLSDGYQRYSQDFACPRFRGFRTLFITTSEARIQNIRQAVAGLGFPEKATKFLWLATQGQVQDTIFEDIWRSADPADSTRYRIG